jgi:hypothetical protein
MFLWEKCDCLQTKMHVLSEKREKINEFINTKLPLPYWIVGLAGIIFIGGFAFTVCMALNQRAPVLIEQNRMQIFLMTKDEMPLLKNWVLWHGSIFGFRNLHIIDGSIDKAAINFLTFIEKTLGVNVEYSTVDLNGLKRLLNKRMQRARSIGDFLIKLDTDEFLFKWNADGNHRVDSISMKHYLENEARMIDGHMYKIGYVIDNKVESDCSSRDDILLNTKHYTEVLPAGGFKTFFPTSTFDYMDLGSHYGRVNVKSDPGMYHSSELGIIHFHFQCYENFVNNNIRAMISHQYINANDSIETRIEKLAVVSQSAAYSSFHKALELKKYYEDPSYHKKSYFNQFSDPDGVKFPRNFTFIRNKMLALNAEFPFL